MTDIYNSGLTTNNVTDNYDFIFVLLLQYLFINIFKTLFFASKFILNIKTKLFFLKI